MVIRLCDVCNAAKYVRNPEEAPMMVTETPSRPWELVEVDVFTWAGAKYLTVIDRLTKLGVAKLIANKSAAKVKEALIEIFGQ